jgi:SPX domain protein involved in polyphosphate accumulation
MNADNKFERYELKYLITQEQKENLLKLFQTYMVPDQFEKTTIFNLYYDTPDFLLIRRSIEKPVYKEKLRLRSYGKTKPDTHVFLELKKKYQSIVYKRRVSLKEKDAMDYFRQCYELEESQISKEIDYFKSLYTNLAPRVFIAYDRLAYLGKEDSNFRITFDKNIVWREDDLSLSSDKQGHGMLPKDTLLMEIKVSKAIPLWLTHFLTENKMFKTSYSKYGNAYKQIMQIRKDQNRAA